jgi:hypothetical protein
MTMNRLETVLEEAREQILALAERLKTETEAESKEGPSRKTIGNLEKALEKLRKVVVCVEVKFFNSPQALQRSL